MKRSLKGIESEIVYQIWISELCFDICKSIQIISGRWSDFLPYYYNLNFIKWLLSLHSLLLSDEKDELSIKNYIKKYKLEYMKSDIWEFENIINWISDSFKNIFPIPLRHKIAAHIAESFTHTDFTSAYIIPTLIPKYIETIKQLKDVFFGFCNRDKYDYPFLRIKEQSDKILKNILDE